MTSNGIRLLTKYPKVLISSNMENAKKIFISRAKSFDLFLDIKLGSTNNVCDTVWNEVI